MMGIPKKPSAVWKFLIGVGIRPVPDRLPYGPRNSHFRRKSLKNFLSCGTGTGFYLRLSFDSFGLWHRIFWGI
jgi:hypothetical protein